MTHNEDSHLEFTGERFLPEVAGQIAFEHLHRYHFARCLVGGKHVLDVACGEGYGSDILAKDAASVVGVDIAAEAVSHAQARYGRDGLRFIAASAAALPFEDASFDAVVSFETIEHHDRHEEMMSEVRRVMRPGGLLIISSPNKRHYSIEPSYTNPFHVKELFREEFVALVGRYFGNAALFGQRVVHGSLMMPVEATSVAAGFTSLSLNSAVVTECDGLARPLYDVLVASDSELPPLHGSLFEITVHGMDPAGFYGVHLPDRVSTADSRIGRLEADLAGARAQSDSLQEVTKQVGSIDGKVERLLQGGEMVQRLDGGLATMCTKLDRLLDDREVEQALNAGLERLGVELDAARERVASADRNLETLAATYAVLDASHSELVATHAALDVSHSELMATHAALDTSHSELMATHAALDVSHSELVATHAALDVSHSELMATHAALDVSYSRLQAANVDLEAMYVTLKASNENLQAAHASAEVARVDLADRLAARERQLKEMFDSFSWRSTTWVRAVSRLLRGRR